MIIMCGDGGGTDRPAFITWLHNCSCVTIIIYCIGIKSI